MIQMENNIDLKGVGTPGDAESIPKTSKSTATSILKPNINDETLFTGLFGSELNATNTHGTENNKDGLESSQSGDIDGDEELYFVAEGPRSEGEINIDNINTQMVGGSKKETKDGTHITITP